MEAGSEDPAGTRRSDDAASAVVAGPAVPAEFDGLPSEPTVWPVALGWVLVGYAAIGILMNLCGAAWMHWYAPVMRSLMGLEVPPIPTPVIVTGTVTAALAVGLGVMLLRGAWLMRQRRIRGVRLVQRWVMLRLALVAVSLVMGLLLVKANVQWSADVADAAREAARRQAEQSVSGPPPGMGGGRRGGMRGGRGRGMSMSVGAGGGEPELAATGSSEMTFRLQIIGVATQHAALAVMPLVAGFLLSGARRRREWECWREDEDAAASGG